MVETVPARKFHIGDNTPHYRLDWNCNGSGIVIHVIENIFSKLFVISTSIEGSFILLNLSKKRCLLCRSCNFLKVSQNLIIITKNVDTLFTKYYDVVLVEDFNSDKKDANLRDICQFYSLKRLIKVLTCFKTEIIH